MTTLQKQRSILLGETWLCDYKFQCMSMMLGGLEKHMFANGLSPAPSTPFLGIGYQGLVDKVCKFEPPKWHEDRSERHTCSSSRYGYEQLRKLTTDEIVGMNRYYRGL